VAGVGDVADERPSHSAQPEKCDLHLCSLTLVGLPKERAFLNDVPAHLAMVSRYIPRPLARISPQQQALLSLGKI